MFYKKIVFSVLFFMHHAAQPGAAPTATQIFGTHMSALALLSCIFTHHQLPAVDIPYADAQKAAKDALEIYFPKALTGIILQYLKLDLSITEFAKQEKEDPDLWLLFKSQLLTPYIAACIEKQPINPAHFYQTMHMKKVSPQMILHQIMSPILSRAEYNLANNPFQFTVERTYHKPTENHNNCSVCNKEIALQSVNIDRNFLVIGNYAPTRKTTPYSFAQAIDESLENSTKLVTCPDPFCGTKNQFTVNERLVAIPPLLALETGRYFSTTVIPQVIKNLGNDTLPNGLSYHLIGIWFYGQQESHALIHNGEAWYRYRSHSIKQLDKSHVKAILHSKNYPRPTLLFYRLAANSPIT